MKFYETPCMFCRKIQLNKMIHLHVFVLFELILDDHLFILLDFCLFNDILLLSTIDATCYFQLCLLDGLGRISED